MDVRETLYAKATRELRLSSRKLGYGALGLAALGLLIGGSSEDILDKWVSAFICVWAFFCFARYCGDSRDLDNLRHRLVASPPAYPLRPVSPQDEPLVRSYGRVLGQFSTQGVIPVSKLPTSKARIKEALVVAASHADSHEAYNSLRQGYLLLSSFQPVPAGEQDTAAHAATEEFFELEKEWDAFAIGGHGARGDFR